MNSHRARSRGAAAARSWNRIISRIRFSRFHPGLAFALVSTFVATLAAMARAQGSADGAAIDVVAAAEAAPAKPTARVIRGSEGLQVEGTFRVVATPEIAWAVLTDYDGIDGFVSSMRESEVIRREGDHVLVRQVAIGRLFLFSRRMHTRLEVREEPRQRIRFEDVLHQDFEHYMGEWQIVDHGVDLEILYRVDAKPNVAIPGFVARGMFEDTIRQLLHEVEKEISTRAALAGRQPTERSRQ